MTDCPRNSDEGSKKRPFEEKDSPEEDKLSGAFEKLSIFGEHKRAVSSVKVAPSRLGKNRDGAVLVASASADGSCKIWDLNSASLGSELQPFMTCMGHTRGINDVSWNPVSPLIATASDDKTVRLWDAVTSEALVELRGHDNFVFCVDQHHSMVVSGSFDESVKIFDIRTGDCVSTLPAHSDPVTAVSFCRDGTSVCSASHDGLIRIWDVGTGECLKTIYAAGNPSVSSVKYSRNSKYLLAGTLDSTLRLWPVTVAGKNTCAKTYRSKNFVNKRFSTVADFLPNGNIVVGSETNDIVVFDLQTKQVQQVLHGHDDTVLAVSSHDSLPFIASGGMSEDRRVHFWTGDGVSICAAEESPGSKKRSKTDMS